MNFECPFEENFVALLEARKKYINGAKTSTQVECKEADDRLPFDIYKTNQCLRSNELIRRKALKNDTPE